MSRKDEKSPEQNKDAWTSILHLVQTYAETSVLKASIERIPKSVIETTEDEKGMDLLHYAIIANNTEAVSLLFMKGIFKPPHQYKSFPYTHLAARLGHKTILGLLLQERPNDNQPEVFTYKSKSDQARGTSDDDRSKKTPLDLAGKSGHLGCVKIILDHYHGHRFKTGRFKGNEAYIEMACQLDSPHALRLLLSQNPTEEEIKSAVGAALKCARPECLDVLLRLKTNLSSLFEGMNLFHVLFSYSLSFDKKWYERLLAVTTVLIKHGHNVGACIPFRTYPLYSLLSHSSCHDFENTAPYLIACMLLLLNAGADPNFDEAKLEEDMDELRIKSAFGRSGFSSAFHCLFISVDQYAKQMTENRYLKKYMSKCTETLLKHHADPNIVGIISEDPEVRGNSLHGYLKLLPRTGIEEKMVLALLRHGADPDVHVDGHYPITTLIDSLTVDLGETTCMLKQSDLDPIFEILNMMSHSSVVNASAIVTSIEKDRSDIQMGKRQREVFGALKSAITELASGVWSLRKLTSQQIVRCCGRQMDRVLKLPLPMPLKTKLLGLQIQTPMN